MFKIMSSFLINLSWLFLWFSILLKTSPPIIIMIESSGAYKHLLYFLAIFSMEKFKLFVENQTIEVYNIHPKIFFFAQKWIPCENGPN